MQRGAVGPCTADFDRQRAKVCASIQAKTGEQGSAMATVQRAAVQATTEPGEAGAEQAKVLDEKLSPCIVAFIAVAGILVSMLTLLPIHSVTKTDIDTPYYGPSPLTMKDSMMGAGDHRLKQDNCSHEGNAVFTIVGNLNNSLDKVVCLRECTNMTSMECLGMHAMIGEQLADSKANFDGVNSEHVTDIQPSCLIRLMALTHVGEVANTNYPIIYSCNHGDTFTPIPLTKARATLSDLLEGSINEEDYSHCTSVRSAEGSGEGATSDGGGYPYELGCSNDECTIVFNLQGDDGLQTVEDGLGAGIHVCDTSDGGGYPYEEDELGCSNDECTIVFNLQGDDGLQTVEDARGARTHTCDWSAKLHVCHIADARDSGMIYKCHANVTCGTKGACLLSSAKIDAIATMMFLAPSTQHATVLGGGNGACGFGGTEHDLRANSRFSIADATYAHTVDVAIGYSRGDACPTSAVAAAILGSNLVSARETDSHWIRRASKNDDVVLQSARRRLQGDTGEPVPHPTHPRRCH